MKKEQILRKPNIDMIYIISKFTDTDAIKQFLYKFFQFLLHTGKDTFSIYEWKPTFKRK